MNRLGVLAAILTLMWMLSDWDSRFPSMGEINDSELQTIKLGQYFYPVMTRKEHQQLLGLFNAYRIDKNETQSDTEQNALLDPATQAKQHGNLTQVYAGDKVIKLKAIITGDNSRVALLQVLGIDGKDNSTKAVADGQLLMGYKFQVIDNRKVGLYRSSQTESPNQEKATPDIVLMMYQKDNVG